MNKFLSKGYKVPETPSDYMRFQQGANKFRVLSNAVVGYEYWNIDNKPVRLKEYPNYIPEDARPNKDGALDNPKHFWAFVVYNYNTERVQILEITQKGIMDTIYNLNNNEDWGDPKEYDITVNRKGESLETKYDTQPSPKTELTEKIKKAHAAKKVDLDALFTSGSPFESAGSTGDRSVGGAEKINPEDIPF